MQACDHACRQGDDDRVFQDVLAFQGRDKWARPGDFRKQNERQEGGEHVHGQGTDDHPFQIMEKEEDADQHLEEAEAYHERIGIHEGHGPMEQVEDKRLCGTGANHFQGPKPKKDEEQRSARQADAQTARELDDGMVRTNGNVRKVRSHVGDDRGLYVYSITKLRQLGADGVYLFSRRRGWDASHCHRHLNLADAGGHGLG